MVKILGFTVLVETKIVFMYLEGDCDWLVGQTQESGFGVGQTTSSVTSGGEFKLSELQFSHLRELLLDINK